VHKDHPSILTWAWGT